MSVDYTEVIRLAKKGRKAEERSKAAWGCVGAMFMAQLTNLYLGWMFMLAVGIAHAEWIPALPTIGYWWSVLLVVMTRGLFAASSSKSKSE